MKSQTGMKAGNQGSSPFSRTMRSLEVDGFRRSNLVFFCILILLGLWLRWFLFSSVERYEVTDEARLEVDRAAHIVQAPVSGRVVTSNLTLGRAVEAGDLLVELETDRQRLELAEAHALLSTILPQIAALRSEILSVERGMSQEQQSTRVAQEQARAQFQEAEAVARFAEQEEERLKQLRAQGLLAERDYTYARSEAESRRAAAENLRLTAARLEQDQKTRESDRQARLDRLRGEITKLQGQQSTTTAAIQRLDHEIEQRRIRAPLAGQLGEVATLRTGAFVEEGGKLGAVIPPGKLKIVAEFAPPAALGRIRPGQHGRLRLQGYPWTQYGSIRTTVVSVAGEIRDGRVRVELSAEPEPGSRIPLQHGLPGAVEVQVERISPANLVLRAAGRILSEPRSTFTSAVN